MAKDLEMEMDEMPEVDNVGIMQGFLEMMNEDDDLEEDDGEMEAGEMLGRTPDSPEILMNNLRGDMRSIDARRDELADLVGYSAAAETPEPVLAMLQPVLAQQGIGAMVPPGMGLPPGAGMPPGPSPVSPVGAPNMPNVPNVPNMPSEMMTPMQPMPAGGIGDMAPPVQMAEGGLVGAARGLMGTANGMEDISAGTQMLESALGRIKTGNAGGGDFSSMGGGSPMAAGLRNMVGGTPPVDANGMVRPILEGNWGNDATGMPVWSPAVLPGNNPYGSTRSMFQPAAQGYNKGGIVQRFQAGSDEDGVTPVDDTSMGGFPEDIRSLARENILNLIAKQPTRVSDLSVLAKQRADAYRDVLGSNQADLAKLGFLTSLGERGFAYAANVDPATGQPLRGSQLSRFAGAARGLPADLMKMAAATRKEDQAIKMAGLESAEKQISAERESNLKLLESQRKAFSDILKSSAGSDFGKGKEGSAYNFLVGLAPDYALGNTTEEQDRQFESSVKIITTPQFFNDPVTGNRVERRGELPDFAKLAIDMRSGSAPTAQPGAEPAGTGITPEGAIPAVPSAAAVTGPKEPTLFEASERGTGIVPVTSSFIAKFPFMGGMAPGEQQATAFIRNSVNQLNRAIATNPRFAEGEREQIQAELDLMPGLIDNPAAYRNRLIGLDDILGRLERESVAKGEMENLKAEDRGNAREKTNEIRKIRELIGLPPRVTNINEFREIPKGTPFLFYDPREKAFVPRTKR